MPLPRERAAVTAERVAGQCVDFVREKFGFSLPFTPESLLLVDAIVDKIKGTRATESQASTLLHGLGCYAGEVFVRHAKGSWRAAAEMTVEDGPSKSAMVVALPGLVRCDVIGAVFERFRRGNAASVASLYEHHAAAMMEPGGSERARPWDAAVPPSDKVR
jgi:hypothetical protein